MPNPVPGTLLGSYQVEGVIGAGSMGDVFRGVDTGLGRKVAIKILAEKHKDSSELRARFVREGRAVAAIQHPNVVQVFATGTFEERPFIAMEFLEGADLGSTVEKHGPLASVVAGQAILDAAHGLDAACRAGLIHRDVKPSNLVRVKDGRVKVTDFGLAKPVDPGTEPALTALGVVVGTPDYIAPEQARGEAIDEKVDIYALGGTLYFLLTGVPPFRTGKPAEDKYLKVVARHLRQPPPDATAPNPAADPELAQLARQMMAKRANERPDYPVLIAALEGIVDRLGGASTGTPRPRASTQRSQPIPAPTPYGDGSPAVSDQMDTIAGGTDLGAELATVRGGPPAWSLALTGLSAAFLVGAAIFYFTRAAPAAARDRAARRRAGRAPVGADPRGHAAGHQARRHAVVLRRRRPGDPRRLRRVLPQAQGPQERRHQAGDRRRVHVRARLRPDHAQADAAVRRVRRRRPHARVRRRARPHGVGRRRQGSAGHDAVAHRGGDHREDRPLGGDVPVRQGPVSARS
jgi:tRNA A-37 threonylcarbamoyl transferase component Bud32